MKFLREKTPKSEKAIIQKLRQIRELTQSLLDIFKAEEEQTQGRLVSPTLALTLFLGSLGMGKGQLMEDIKE